MPRTATDLLTAADVEKALQDDRHLGFGYWGIMHLDEQTAPRVTEAVVYVANELGLDYEQLFAWVNSKYGRWLTDHGHRAADVFVVRQYLNADAILTLAEGR